MRSMSWKLGSKTGELETKLMEMVNAPSTDHRSSEEKGSNWSTAVCCSKYLTYSSRLSWMSVCSWFDCSVVMDE